MKKNANAVAEGAKLNELDGKLFIEGQSHLREIAKIQEKLTFLFRTVLAKHNLLGIMHLDCDIFENTIMIKGINGNTFSDAEDLFGRLRP